MLSLSKEEWFTPYPLEFYAQIGEETGTNIPDSPPTKAPVGDLQITAGPILRLLGTLENGSSEYRASILIVVKDAAQIPVVTYQLGPSSPSFLKESVDSVQLIDGEFPGTKIYEEKGYSFFRYSIHLNLIDVEQKCVYAINGVNQPNFNFFLPSLSQSMNVVSVSCNGFSLATKTDTYKNSLWYDILKNHGEKHYHVVLGGGDQLYCDKVKQVSKEFQEWLEESNPLKKLKTKMTDELAASLEDFYLNAYMNWFGTGHWTGTQGKTLQSLFPASLACIPTINIYDDHDIIDGYGTYKDDTMSTDVFKKLGKIAFQYYMLFQHHSLPEEKDPSWICGTSVGPYMEVESRSNYVRLGREIGFVGFDCRTERKRDQILTENSYDKIFQRMQKEITESKGEIKHLLVLLGVPIAYPRLVWLEKLLTSRVFYPIKKLSEKKIVAKGLVNEFDGSIEVLDDLEDHWCAKHHKAERNYLVGKLQGFGAKNKVRITILSGDVHLAAVGRFKSKIHQHSVRSKKITQNDHILHEPEKDPRLILNLISSAVTNAPPPDAMATLLQKRSKIHKFDRNTDEDMIALFEKDVDGKPRVNNMFNNKRNWADLILLKQLPKYSELDVNSKTGKLPGLIDADESKLYVPLESNVIEKVAYPVLPDALSATIHVEQTSSKINSPCVNYEVLVPPLVVSEQLADIGVKQ